MKSIRVVKYRDVNMKEEDSKLMIHYVNLSFCINVSSLNITSSNVSVTYVGMAHILVVVSLLNRQVCHIKVDVSGGD